MLSILLLLIIQKRFFLAENAINLNSAEILFQINLLILIPAYNKRKKKRFKDDYLLILRLAPPQGSNPRQKRSSALSVSALLLAGTPCSGNLMNYFKVYKSTV